MNSNMYSESLETLHTHNNLKDKKLKILELFAGIGACSKAIENLGIEYEIIDAVEIDEAAIKSFNAIHNTNFKVQDIRQWNKGIDVDLIMHRKPMPRFFRSRERKGWR